MPDRCDSVGTPLPFTKGRGRGWGQIIYNGLINREKARKIQTYAKILRNNIEVDPKGSQEYERPSASYRRNVTPSLLPL